MKLDKEKIDEAVLAILILGLHDDGRVWKGFDWDSMHRLHEKGFIADPRSKSKSVVLTEEGTIAAKQILQRDFEAKSSRSLWIMISGPYRSGSSDPSVWGENLRKLNVAANEILKKGHVPIMGVNMALPVIDAAAKESYEDIMMPLSLNLAERCDAVLRIGGVSVGADQEVERFISRGLRVFRSSDEVFDVRSPVIS